jgi:UDP-N-acetylmuramoylalanine-D-glutamate ligase
MRRRYVYREIDGQAQAFEVGADYQRHEERQPVFTDRYMEGVTATDGADIGSRVKRREYMRAHNLADFDDFRHTFEKMQKEREATFRTPSKAERVEAVREAIQQLRRKNGR